MRNQTFQCLWKRKDGGEGLTWLLSRINVRVDDISKRQQEMMNSSLISMILSLLLSFGSLQTKDFHDALWTNSSLLLDSQQGQQESHRSECVPRKKAQIWTTVTLVILYRMEE